MAASDAGGGWTRARVQRIGRPAGPALAALVWLALPESPLTAAGEPIPFGPAGCATAALAAWMAVWWLSEAIPVYATALLPLLVLPLLGARGIQETAAPYAHPMVFLFMGGFLIALTMERWGLHRRVALVALRLAGDRPAHVVGSFMAVTAFTSLWVSNSATAVMMLPVALSVIDLVARQMGGPDRTLGAGGPLAPTDPGSPVRPFAVSLLLGVAYASSIGGVGTPIGTPPNLFLLSWLHEQSGREISFVRWMAVGVPLVIVFLPLCWLLLTRAFPAGFDRIRGGAELVEQALAELGPMKAGERVTLGVFLLAVALWIGQPMLVDFAVAGHRPLSGLSDASIAMLAALLLFVLPVDRRAGTFALDWHTAERLPFGVLILFGGGLSLAAAIEANGVAELLGAQVAGFGALPGLAVVLLVVTGVVFLSELASNTAIAAAVVPILGALAPGLGLDPLLLVVPATLAASCAFMLPAGTPPNAVVFGTGMVGMAEMSRAGFWLNWIGVVLITVLTYAVAMPLLAQS